ncbi:hypothetical protein K2Q16_04105 [Patescibacteria group bacterium]|nr:hypothetical protein [Patescibacteria group bacterium]
MNKVATHKRPSLGPLEKPPKKRFVLSPNAKVIVRHVAIGVTVLSVVALTISAIWYGTRVSSLTIASVTAAGGETIDAEEVRSRAEGVLDGTYGKIIPRRFSWFYPQADMLAAVGQVERIRDVVIQRSSQTSLHISYGEHMPFALWCDEAVAPITTDTCLFINERGYAFAHAPQLEGGSFVRYRSPGTTPEIGKEVMGFDSFWNTVSFTELLAFDGLYVSSVEIDAASDVYYGLTTGGELRAALADPAAQVADNLRTILRSDEFTHLRDESFYYIDLRFGNKVYVSETNPDLLASALASSTATTTDDTMATKRVPENEEATLNPTATEIAE